MEPVGTFGNSGAEYFQAATVSLTATMSSEQLGSDPYGRALSTLTCARSHNFHGTINPCRKIGVLLCSKVSRNVRCGNLFVDQRRLHSVIKSRSASPLGAFFRVFDTFL